MSTIEHKLPHTTEGVRSFGWWGMVWLIATEATLFASLIASYFYLRFRHGVAWPPDGLPIPELSLPIVMSVILLSSSIPVHVAEAGIKKGKVTVLRWGLAIGFLLGATFLGLTVGVEWPETLHHFTPRTNVYGSLFFTITGFHAAHVLVGLVMNLWTQARAAQGAFDAKRHVTVQNFTMYWHFVDIVWVFVFTTLYLSPASMSSALLWFGVLGAPAAWAIQLTLNYSLEEWFACAPSTTDQGRVLGTSVPTVAVIVSIALAAVAVGASVAALSSYRKVARDDGNEVSTRALWMARAGIMNSILYLIIVAASLGPPLLLDVCRVSP